MIHQADESGAMKYERYEKRRENLLIPKLDEVKSLHNQTGDYADYVVINPCEEIVQKVRESRSESSRRRSRSREKIGDTCRKPAKVAAAAYKKRTNGTSTLT
jgi:hypothetical protein